MHPAIAAFPARLAITARLALQSRSCLMVIADTPVASRRRPVTPIEVQPGTGPELHASIDVLRSPPVPARSAGFRPATRRKAAAAPVDLALPANHADIRCRGVHVHGSHRLLAIALSNRLQHGRLRHEKMSLHVAGQPCPSSCAALKGVYYGLCLHQEVSAVRRSSPRRKSTIASSPLPGAKTNSCRRSHPPQCGRRRT